MPNDLNGQESERQTRRLFMPVRISKKKEPEDNPRQNPSEGKPGEARFRLQVDRQTKATYDTLEGAETAGMAIKKSHPIVHIDVYDHVEGTSKVIETPDA